jgi:hypothetical protein
MEKAMYDFILLSICYLIGALFVGVPHAVAMLYCRKRERHSGAHVLWWEDILRSLVYPTRYRDPTWDNFESGTELNNDHDRIAFLIRVALIWPFLLAQTIAICACVIVFGGLYLVFMASKTIIDILASAILKVLPR